MSNQQELVSLAEQMREMQSAFGLPRKAEGEPITLEEINVALSDAIRLLQDGAISARHSNKLSRIAGKVIGLVKSNPALLFG